MTGFLASVTSVEEAAVALDFADIIDLKNPAAGALGALPLSVVRNVVQFVGGRKPVSATIGDLPMVPEILPETVAMMRDQGVDIVKVGLFGGANQNECIDRLGGIADQCKIVAVLFADHTPDLAVLEQLSANGFYGAMLDTADKARGSLRHHMDDSLLLGFTNKCKESNLFTGLAGSLSVEDIPPLCQCGADYLGFRGALCVGRERRSALSAKSIQIAAALLRKCNTVEEVCNLELQS